MVGNPNGLKDRFIGAGDTKTTGLRMAFPKDTTFILEDGAINYTLLSDASHTYNTGNLRVTLTRKTFWNENNTSRMHMIYDMQVTNTTNNILSGWSFTIFANGLSNPVVIDPLYMISSSSNGFTLGPINPKTGYNLSPNDPVPYDSKIEFILDDVNAEISVY